MVRRVRVLLAVGGLVVLSASSAGDAAAPRAPQWLVFETRLTWTRTVEIESEIDGVRCVSQARMTARSDKFYVGRHPVKNYAHRLRFGSKPDTPWFQKGASYSPDTNDPHPAAVARVVASPTRCGDRILHPECAGTYSGRIELFGFSEATRAETRRRVMLWSHRAPKPPSPLPPQSCLREEDRGHLIAALGLMISGGPTPQFMGTMPIDSPQTLMFTKRRFTLTGSKRDFQWLGGPAASDGTVVTSGTFVRVR